MLPLSGNLGEVKALQATLLDRKDIIVKVGSWIWTERDPFPSLEVVMKTPFWSGSQYEFLRQRLREPVIEPDISSTAEYVTVNLRHADTNVEPEPDPTQATQSSAPPRRKPKRSQGVCHVVPFHLGAAFPEDLAKLTMKVMVWEVAENSFVSGVNPRIKSNLRRGIPLLVGGDYSTVTDLINVLKEGIRDRNLKALPIDIYFKESRDQRRLFSQFRAAFISIDWPEFKVCTLPSLPLPQCPVPPWNFIFLRKLS